MPEVTVIVNVDDLGLHDAVLNAVLEGHKKNIITSSSLLANGPHIETAVNAVKHIDSLGIGVHLNILRGQALLPKEDIPSLTDDKGYFFGRYAPLAKSYLNNKLNLNEVEMEWEAQIRHCIDLGITPTHLDSEKHIHCWPQLFKIALQLAKKYKIKWLRRVRENIHLSPLHAGALKAQLLNHWCRQHDSVNQLQGVNFVTNTWGICHSGQHLKAAPFKKYLKNLKAGAVVELVCHPGLPESDNNELGKGFEGMYSHKNWRMEYESLTSEEFSSTLVGGGCKMAHFGQLNP